jgi:hypothetical protein
MRKKAGILLLGLIVLALSFLQAGAQEITDRTVATVSDTLSRPELITYSDLLWQLALEPDVSLTPPSSDDLNRALQLIINQRLFALEAQRLPRTAPTDEEVNAEIKRVLALFPSTAEFEQRLRQVGFDSVQDDNFRRVMEQRVAIEKYLDFRFRSFIIVSPAEETKYYRDVFVPEFRKKNPGHLVPAQDEVRVNINRALTETKVEADIEKFLDEAKRRAEIEILSGV